MPDPFLLSRVLLRFGDDDDDLLNELSAAAFTPDGSLWVGSDEFRTLERLFPIEPCIYGNHETVHLKDYIDLFNLEDEIDIEGMDYSEPYLWVVGSHSTKRGKPKGKDVEKDIKALSKIKTDANRFMLMRLPFVDGKLYKAYDRPNSKHDAIAAGALKTSDQGNVLMDALCEDAHLGSIVSSQLPSKDNGLDIEGLAVSCDRIYLGLRGPVLRGWAIILELEVEADESGTMTLKPIGPKKQPYRKHFFNLGGLGIRELCFHNDDLLILAGPTMDLSGAMQLYRWHNPLNCDTETVTDQDSKYLELVFTLPFNLGQDNAEGLALCSCLEQPDGLLVVYDSPDPKRRVQEHEILMDIFRL
ncbi:MAG: DUF3616 domain-containing protein [Thainema sp.]